MNAREAGNFFWAGFALIQGQPLGSAKRSTATVRPLDRRPERARAVRATLVSETVKNPVSPAGPKREPLYAMGTR